MSNQDLKKTILADELSTKVTDSNSLVSRLCAKLSSVFILENLPGDKRSIFISLLLTPELFDEALTFAAGNIRDFDNHLQDYLATKLTKVVQKTLV